MLQHPWKNKTSETTVIITFVTAVCPFRHHVFYGLCMLIWVNALCRCNTPHFMSNAHMDLSIEIHTDRLRNLHNSELLTESLVEFPFFILSSHFHIIILILIGVET